MKNKQTYCPIPWIFQAVRNNGDIRVCCQANVTRNQGVVRHKNNSSYNAGKDNLSEARNATLMKNIRKNMLEGIWNEECNRCKTEEESGLNSRRNYELEQWNYNFNNALADTLQDGTLVNQPVVYYDLRFGNFCNLACRMCGPTDSHTWYKHWTKYHNSNSYEDTHGTVYLEKNKKGRLVTNDYDWHSSETFWNQLNKNIKNIKHVYMAGGEPLLIDRHYEFLQKCIDTNYSKDIIIEYNTNMTVLPNKVLDMWKQFKQVRIGASIDGMGKVLEYQRWPIKWESAYENLIKLDKLCQQNNNIISWLAYTVTAYNVWHLPEFMHWKIFESGFKKINSTKRRPIITHHVAHGPKRTNIKMLPKQYKEEIKIHYEKNLSKIKEKDIDNNVKIKYENILKGITKYLEADLDSKYFEQFKDFTKFLDNERNQNVAEIAPNLVKYI